MHYDEAIEIAMHVGVVPKTSTDIALWMRHRYETDYGIYNHDVDDTPFSLGLCLQHPAESITNHIEERMRDFANKRVGKYFNISWLEFISQPRADCDRMLRISAEMCNKDNVSLENVLGTEGKP